MKIREIIDTDSLFLEGGMVSFMMEICGIITELGREPKGRGSGVEHPALFTTGGVKYKMKKGWGMLWHSERESGPKESERKKFLVKVVACVCVCV